MKITRKHANPKTYSNTVDVPDGESDLLSQLLLVEFHLDDFERKPLVEQTVDFRAARQFVGVDQRRTGAFDRPLEVRLELLYHSKKIERSNNKKKETS